MQYIVPAEAVDDGYQDGSCREHEEAHQPRGDEGETGDRLRQRQLPQALPTAAPERDPESRDGEDDDTGHRPGPVDAGKGRVGVQEVELGLHERLASLQRLSWRVGVVHRLLVGALVLVPQQLSNGCDGAETRHQAGSRP